MLQVNSKKINNNTNTKNKLRNKICPSFVFVVLVLIFGSNFEVVWLFTTYSHYWIINYIINKILNNIEKLGCYCNTSYLLFELHFMLVEENFSFSKETRLCDIYVVHSISFQTYLYRHLKLS